MNVIRITPSGYCFGVVNAINTVIKANKSNIPKPINVYGMLIHNKMVIKALEEIGIKTIYDPKISDLDDITGTVVFTAHGISKKIIKKAKENGLNVINATCRDVTKTHNIIDDYIHDGYEVIYIGKKNHPEAVSSTESDKVHLIETIADLDKINFNKKLAVTNQTTMSIFDVKHIYAHIKENYPNVIIINEICNATRRRQLAVLEHIDVDKLFVVGDKKSNNSNNLAKLHPKGILIENIYDIDESNLSNLKTVAVTAGASTPKAIIDEVVKYLENYDKMPKKISKLSNKDILRLK
ncbi:4-hydroxy-3-methylbut-2-enyl diphosphate reductase [Mycoplasmatota bacterium WC44]